MQITVIYATCIFDIILRKHLAITGLNSLARLHMVTVVIIFIVIVVLF